MKCDNSCIYFDKKESDNSRVSVIGCESEQIPEEKIIKYLGKDLECPYKKEA